MKYFSNHKVFYSSFIPAPPKSFICFANQIFWSADDLVSATASIDNNSYIDTSTVGPRSITITAIDKAGNVLKKTITYYVRYDFSGILQPVNADGSSLFKIGRTVPIKFRLTDINGNYITNAIAKLNLEKIGDEITGNNIEADSTSATTGNLFRYDAVENQYIFNLSTKELTSGTWKLKIVLNDGSTKKVIISLQAK